MTVQSLSFLAFVAGAAAVFWLAPRRFKGHVLLAASYAFYASWSLPHTGLLVAATMLAYAAARRIQKSVDENTKRRLAIATSIALLGVLASFKYAPLGFIAPLGISYYIFKLVGYVLDVSWENIPAERSLLVVANFAAFFPQMVCGPIQRGGDFFAQASSLDTPTVDTVSSGLRVVLFGFFKKLVVADQIGTIIDPFFSQFGAQPPSHILIALYLFPIQLYADFSGITDIAIGVGRLFGIESPPNFNSPLYAPNITDFWRRWHMTLSSWLRDYLFTPLRHATRRLGNMGLVLSIMTTMVAIGIWHGPRWSYVAFGLVNGIYMSVSALTLTRRNRWFKAHPSLTNLRRIAGPLVLFHLIVGAFAFFRVPTASGAIMALAHGVPALLHPWTLVATVSEHASRFGIVMFGVAAMEAGHLAQRQGLAGDWFHRRPIWIRWGVYYAAALAVALLGAFTTTTFIYAQF